MFLVMIMILGYGVSNKQMSSFEPADYIKMMDSCNELETKLTHAEKASEELVEAVVRGVVE